MTSTYDRRQSARATSSSALVTSSTYGFTTRAATFSAVNAVVGIACWKAHGRPIVAFAAGLNSFLALIGVTFQSDVAGLANCYLGAASANAAVIYSLHMGKTSSLRVPSNPSAVVFGCFLGALWLFALDRLSWVYALRHDN